MKTGAHLVVLFAGSFLVSACAADSTPVGPSPLSKFAGAPAGVDPPSGSAWAEAYASHRGAPEPVPFAGMMSFVNPCTGLPDTVTISGTLWIHDVAVVVRSESTLVTASGFEGERHRTIVEKDGKIFKVSLNGMMASASGDRIRIHFILLIDLAAGTTRVLQGGAPACIGA